MSQFTIPRLILIYSLLPDDKLYFDANGNVEDHVSNGAEFTTLEEP
ncbi:MAG: hypothetical protein R3F19_09440 [Verrucomicrobiales bacterium]